jgi:hypothetical protein
MRRCERRGTGEGVRRPEVLGLRNGVFRLGVSAHPILCYNRILL